MGMRYGPEDADGWGEVEFSKRAKVRAFTTAKHVTTTTTTQSSS